MGQVTSLDNVRPKTLKKKYKNHDYVISFLVAERKWAWSVTYVETTVFTGEPKDSINAAQRAAERHIDRTLELKGR